MYCEKCMRVFKGSLCPFCCSGSVRLEQPQDLCFLTEKSQIWSDMLADVLQQHHIAFLRKGRLGAGMTMQVGSYLESHRFYVSCQDYAQAAALTEELFGVEEPQG